MLNVISEVVKKGRCCGCGICAGINNLCLSMQSNSYGDYIPVANNCNACGACLKICPFSISNNLNNENNDDGLLGGGAISTYVGKSNIDHERKIASSGGMVTRLLTVIMKKGLINGVLTICPSNKKGSFFEARLITDPDSLSKCSGSKYYPIEYSTIINDLKKLQGQYAIVALPCVANGIKLLQSSNKLWAQKIKYIFGLTCGHNNNKMYTSFLLWLLGIDESKVESIDYRYKGSAKRAINYGFRVKLTNGEYSNTLPFATSIVKDIWCKYFFSNNACFNCSDTFAKHADISFMDAWLPEYEKDPLGTSMIIVRNSELEALLKNENDVRNISIRDISKEEIVKSQEGSIKLKKRFTCKKRSHNGKYIIFKFNRLFSNILYSIRVKKYSIGAFILKIFILLVKKIETVKYNELRIKLLNKLT